jgi:formylglycine-generating enzyme required for sulfatase activity
MHPVNAANASEAKDFCEWLAQRERRLGLLTAREQYRIPTDDGWLAARGTEASPRRGNFAEWSQGPPQRVELYHRGGSWSDGEPAAATPGHHRARPAFQFNPAAGFRVVVERP